MYCNIDNDCALDLLMARLAHWTNDDTTTRLFSDMYENEIFNGCFDGSDFDPMVIVDNDYVNWCGVVEKGDDEYAKIKKVFDEQGYGDCSCEDCEADFIEAYDEATGAFLIRNC